jgi:hypothetical protein
MGNDGRRFVIDCHGQTHDVANLYVCDCGRIPEVHGQDNHDQYHGIQAEDLRTPDRKLPAGRA